MEFEEVLKERRSVREFLEKPVSKELVKKILELANLSPSAGNLQARKVVLIKDKETKKKLAQAANGQDFLCEAPLVFIICAVPEESAAKYGERGRKLYALQDATIFTSYLQLAVASLGLASCWVGAFEEEEIKRILELRENLRPIAIIPIGYTYEKPERTPRKNLDKIIIHQI